MNGRNYQKELDQLIQRLKEEGTAPSLLLHTCCAPCSSYVLKYLSAWFRITVFYYNPNIYPPSEYEKRVEEQKNLLDKMKFVHPVSMKAGLYCPDDFYQAVKGVESIPEGGERCFRCYGLRLREAAREAKAGGFDYFTTSLSISPMKNAAKLNKIGEKIALEFGVRYLNSDFKKKNGYKRSIELSGEYGLYRQDYCGCVYSLQESRERRERMALEKNRDCQKGLS